MQKTGSILFSLVKKQTTLDLHEVTNNYTGIISGELVKTDATPHTKNKVRTEGSQKHGLTIIHTNRLRTVALMLSLSHSDQIICSIPHSFVFTLLAKRQTRSHNQCRLSA